MDELFSFYFDRLRRLPFPKLGKEIGDFALYDALLSGVAHNYARGINARKLEIPEPDEMTCTALDGIAKKQVLTEDERQLLDYFNNLELIRDFVTRDAC